MTQRRAVRKSREAPRATNILTLRRPFFAGRLKSRGCVWRTGLNTGLLVFPMDRRLSSAHATRPLMAGCCIGTLTHIDASDGRPLWLA